MSAMAQAVGIGFILGIVIFFICARIGWIDKLIASMDKWFR